jgi:dienelactone hydrolase
MDYYFTYQRNSGMYERIKVVWLAFLCLIFSTTTTLGEQPNLRIELYPIQTETLTATQFLTGENKGAQITIAGELRMPFGMKSRMPAVVLVHGAGGITTQIDPWARELSEIGIAVFILDSFTGRGVGEGIVPESRVSFLTMLVDAYRALELLSNHPRIDPSRIAIMGFSRGGRVAMYASLKRFQRMHGPVGVEFVAYLPFYPACWTTYIEDEQVSERPIRIFHGTADNWTPIEPCRKYVERLRKRGKDVQLIEYPGAYHAFDAPGDFIRQFPNATGLGTCECEERSGGLVVNRATGVPWKPSDTCATKGTTIGGNPQARAEAIKAVKEFLTATFKLEK